jgi:hypothetical protein
MTAFYPCHRLRGPTGRAIFNHVGRTLITGGGIELETGS